MAEVQEGACRPGHPPEEQDPGSPTCGPGPVLHRPPPGPGSLRKYRHLGHRTVQHPKARPKNRRPAHGPPTHILAHGPRKRVWPVPSAEPARGAGQVTRAPSRPALGAGQPPPLWTRSKGPQVPAPFEGHPGPRFWRSLSPELGSDHSRPAAGSAEPSTLALGTWLAAAAAARPAGAPTQRRPGGATGRARLQK